MDRNVVRMGGGRGDLKLSVSKAIGMRILGRPRLSVEERILKKSDMRSWIDSVGNRD